MSNRLGGKQGTAYVGTNANQPPNLTFQNRAPTQFDIGYSVGDFWMDDSVTFNQRLWVLVSLEGNSTSKGQVAHWVQLGPGVPSNVNTLTGNSGGVVPPDGANNINVIGDGVSANVVGTPGTNTLTISATTTVPLQFDADVGSATAIANIINVVGAGSTTTSAVGNTITINSTGGGSGILTLTGDIGGAVGPDGANNVNILGSADIVVTGNPGTNTLTIDSAGFLANQFDTDLGTAIPVGGILEILAQNATLGAGSTVLFSAPGATNIVQLNVTDASANTIIGQGAGILTASGNFNSGYGYQSLASLTTGSNNSSFSTQSGNAITTGSDNTLLGYQAAGSLVSGSNNSIIGSQSGSSYMGAESDNILINNAGVLGESDTIRIGTNGTQTSAYVQGIYNTTGLTSPLPVVVQSNGQLGTQLRSAFDARVNPTIANVTGNNTIYTVIFNSVSYDLNGDYNNATGQFTAPVDGIYHFNTTTFGIGINNALFISSFIQLTLNAGAGLSYTGTTLNAFACRAQDPNNTLAYLASATIQLNAGDTVQVRFAVANGPKTVSVLTSSVFTGYLVYEL